MSAVADELYKRTGIRYTYTCKGGSGTCGLLTRHPVLSADAVNGNLWFYRTVIDFYGQQMALYASHAYHMYYACYLPRGYGDGSSPYGWDKLADGPITDVDFILEREESGARRSPGISRLTPGPSRNRDASASSEATSTSLRISTGPRR